MSSVVTGEAVRLQLPSATFFTRALGALLDVLVVVISYVIGWIIIAAAISHVHVDRAALSVIALTWTVACLIGLPVTVETLTRGKSVGKAAAGLRVVRDDGGAIRFRHALIRAMLGMLEIYLSLGAVAALTSLLNPRGKRIGDLVAGTYAIRERVTVPAPGLTSMPTHLAAWATMADIRGIPDDLARRVNRFMGQALAMAPASRARMAIALADETARFVAPQPPAGTDPASFLAAVVTERRNRDFARLSREAVRAEALQRRTSRLPFLG